MIIFITTLTGKQFQMDVCPTDTIKKVKKGCFNESHVAIERLRIIFCGKEYTNECTIKDVGIATESTLHLIVIDEKDYWNDIFNEMTRNMNKEIEDLKTQIHKKRKEQRHLNKYLMKRLSEMMNEKC
jgi:hypothetical protein